MIKVVFLTKSKVFNPIIQINGVLISIKIILREKFSKSKSLQIIVPIQINMANNIFKLQCSEQYLNSTISSYLLSIMSQEQIDRMNRTVSQRSSFEQICCQFQTVFGSIKLNEANVRTIKANRTFSKGQILLTVPSKYFITPKQDFVLKSPFVSYVQKLTEQLQQRSRMLSVSQLTLQKQLLQLEDKQPDWSCLIYLIQRRFLPLLSDCDSQVERIHQHYINILPTNYKYLPENYESNIKPYHQGVFKLLKSQNRRKENFVKCISNLMDNSNTPFSFQQSLKNQGKQHQYICYLDAFCQQNLTWAKNTFRTRSFQPEGLVPLLDLFNHSSTPNSTWFHKDSEKQISLISTREIENDEQIMVNYNDGTIQQFFCHYGFLSIGQTCRVNVPFCNNQKRYEAEIVQKLYNFPHSHAPLAIANLLVDTLQFDHKYEAIDKTILKSVINLLLFEIAAHLKSIFIPHRGLHFPYLVQQNQCQIYET